jgi:hypothetical protein
MMLAASDKGYSESVFVKGQLIMLKNIVSTQYRG